MSRRVSKSAAIFLALTIALSTPSAFAATRGPSMDPSLDPSFGPIERIVRVVEKFKKAVKSLGQKTQTDDPSILPRPPLP